MISIRNIRRVASALALTASLSPPPASAQDVRSGQAQLLLRRAVELPCCRCVDGHRQTVPIHTGTAPWYVRSPGSGAFVQVVPAATAYAPQAPAAWVAPPGNPSTPGPYVYELQINVPRCIIPARITVRGRFGADNNVTLTLGGNSASCTNNVCFYATNATPYGPWPISGSVILQAVVQNNEGPTGLVVVGDITIECPRQSERGDLEQGPRPRIEPVEPG